jgi:hypothetical protein
VPPGRHHEQGDQNDPERGGDRVRRGTGFQVGHRLADRERGDGQRRGDQQRGGRVDQRGRLALLAWLGAYGAGQQPRQNYGAQHEDRHPDDNQRGIVLVHTTDKRNSGERNALPGQQPNDGR